jgi:hypothetical protein
VITECGTNKHRKALSRKNAVRTELSGIKHYFNSNNNKESHVDKQLFGLNRLKRRAHSQHGYANIAKQKLMTFMNSEDSAVCPIQN